MTTLTLQQSTTTLAIRTIMATDKKLTIDASIPDVFLCAGMAQFEMTSNGNLECNLILVDAAHRNKGIAAALFDFAEAHFERSITCGRALTPLLLDFYRSRDIAIASDAQVKPFAEWFGPTN